MIFVYITTKDKEQARYIGKKLLEERLVACVNIIDNMESIYWWSGELTEDTETVLIAKTREPLLDKLTQKVKSLHSYACPCIVALPVLGGNTSYLQWIKDETKE